MKTDKQVFLIFQTQPEWLFQLIGKPSPGKCRMRSVTRKALERTTDGLIEPLDPSQDLTISEFQFQLEPKIYLRVIEAMTGAQGDNNMRGVRGIIIFPTRVWIRKRNLGVRSLNRLFLRTAFKT